MTDVSLILLNTFVVQDGTRIDKSKVSDKLNRVDSVDSVDQDLVLKFIQTGQEINNSNTVVNDAAVEKARNCLNTDRIFRDLAKRLNR